MLSDFNLFRDLYRFNVHIYSTNLHELIDTSGIDLSKLYYLGEP